MKIIEERHGQRIICHSCQSILEYTKSDIHFETANYNRTDEYIVCPICNHRIYLVN